MNTNFLYAQAPNRKGNVSKHTPTGIGGATGVCGPAHGVSGPKGQQGAPKATGNIASRNQKVMVSTHADYCGTIKNDGYMNSDRNNFLK
tara:strand:- start:4507 stop:4773 length:267 start_codon:yes stop_codon:yes gene_type:complete